MLTPVNNGNGVASSWFVPLSSSELVESVAEIRIGIASVVASFDTISFEFALKIELSEAQDKGVARPFVSLSLS
jgi:hypothetical protein